MNLVNTVHWVALGFVCRFGCPFARPFAPTPAATPKKWRPDGESRIFDLPTSLRPREVGP